MLRLISKNYWGKNNFRIILILLLAMTFSHSLAQDHIKEATKYFFMKDYNNAIAEYNLALKQNPDDPQIYFNIATCYEKLGDAKSAINFYNKALKLRPDFSQAKEALKKLRSHNQSRNVKESPTALQKANNAFDQKKYNSAIKYYADVIQIDPQNYSAYFNLAYSYEKKENYEEALRLYKRALNLNRSSEEAKAAVQRLQLLTAGQKILVLKNKFDVAFEENRFEEALKIIDQILVIEPENGWAVTKRELINARLQQQTNTPATRTTNNKNKAIAKIATTVSKIKTTTLFLLLGIVIVLGIPIVILISKTRKKTQPAADEPQKQCYDLLQDYFKKKKTGIFLVEGSTEAGENIQGEVRISNGNIVNVQTNKLEGVSALYQLFKIEPANRLDFQKTTVPAEGNINETTSNLLIQWKLDKIKR